MDHKLKILDHMKNNPFLIFLRDLKYSPKGIIGGAIILAYVIIAIFAPFISPYDPIEMTIEEKIMPPCRKHLFGTDFYGRDLLSRVIWGSRVSMYVGIVSVCFALIVGITFGCISGYYRGKIDEVISRAVDIMMSFPYIVLALVIIASIGIGLKNMLIALGIVFSPRFIRLTRGVMLAEREKIYVEAAKATGEPDRRIMLIEMLPNCLAPISVQVTISFAYAVLWEAALSFLGLGVQPPTPAWGYMLSEARAYMEYAPWMLVFPGLAILFCVLAFNLFGDALRDITDPRLRIE